jgi:hypothetical protein
VVRIALDDGTKADDSRIFSADSASLCDERNFKRAGHAHEIDAILRNAMAFQRIKRPGDERFDNQ